LSSYEQWIIRNRHNRLQKLRNQIFSTFQSYCIELGVYCPETLDECKQGEHNNLDDNENESDNKDDSNIQSTVELFTPVTPNKKMMANPFFRPKMLLAAPQQQKEVSSRPVFHAIERWSLQISYAIKVGTSATL
jgi:hypothetical protein